MLFSLSASHATADFAVLERLAVAEATTPRRLVNSHPHIRGVVVLVTCNRFEAYLDLEHAHEAAFVDPVAAAIEAIAASAEMEPRDLRANLRFAHGLAAVQHLFAVTSGLESVAVGEDEIVGQVRRALDEAQAAGAASPELGTIIQRAVEASREVRCAAGIGVAGRSIVRSALDLAGVARGESVGIRALLVGTGQYAAVSLAALRDRGVTDLRVYSVSDWGAQFAAGHDLPLIRRPDYPREAARATLIVACTRAHHQVLDAATLEAGRATVNSATRGRRELPAAQVIVDLGMPRNIDPDVASLPGVTLLDLETIRRHAPHDDVASLADARALVETATRRFSSATRARELAPGLAALRAHVTDLIESEVARARNRPNFTPATEDALRHLAGVLLHAPMSRSRELADRGEASAWLEGLSAVFGIDVTPNAEGDGMRAATA